MRSLPAIRWQARSFAMNSGSSPGRLWSSFLLHFFPRRCHFPDGTSFFVATEILELFHPEFQRDSRWLPADPSNQKMLQ